MKSKPEIMPLFDILKCEWGEFKNDSDERIFVTLLIFLTTWIQDPSLTRMVFEGIGFITSYQLYYTYGASKTGDPAFGMLKFSNGFHLHHWMYCTILLIGMWVLQINHPLSIGLGFGGIVHGIQFSDWWS